MSAAFRANIGYSAYLNWRRENPRTSESGLILSYQFLLYKTMNIFQRTCCLSNRNQLIVKGLQYYGKVKRLLDTQLHGTALLRL